MPNTGLMFLEGIFELGVMVMLTVLAMTIRRRKSRATRIASDTGRPR